MDFLIIYCHPYEKSFNHAILESVKSNLAHKHKSFKVIDLYQEQFNPIYDKEELALNPIGLFITDFSISEEKETK